MPVYEYGCPSCGTTSDVRHGFNEKPELACEQCGAALQRRFSAAPIVFKGSGFYVTDSRPKSSETKSETKAETKTETKTGTKTESKSASPKTGDSKGEAAA